MKHLLGIAVAAILASECLAQANWALRNATTSPSARGGHRMVYDSARQRVVLFGGFRSDNSVWEWDGQGWHEIRTKTGPVGRFEHAMAYDAARRRTVLFGGWPNGWLGQSNDTWEWDGKDWTKLTPRTSPIAQNGHAMAYDAARGVTVMFGGGYLDTWTWDGRDWTRQRSPTTPTVRRLHAMAYDSLRGVVVMFGGYYNGDKYTWEWNGKDWKRHAPPVAPPQRRNHAMAYDAQRRRVVLHGGEALGSPSANLGDTWEWDGREWIEIKPLRKPSVRHWHALAYDAHRQESVLFGGFTPYRFTADTWVYGGSPITFRADRPDISNSAGGSQQLSLAPGFAFAGQPYWIFGSASGTVPGVRLDGVDIPLNPDPYTDLVIVHTNSIHFRQFRGVLDAGGKATAAFHIQKNSLPALIGRRVHHGYLVFDASGIRMASNPVAVTLVK